MAPGFTPVCWVAGRGVRYGVRHTVLRARGYFAGLSSATASTWA